MIQFKSDKRYKHYSLGLHYIVEFRWHSAEDRELFRKLCKIFEEMYGPIKERHTHIDSGAYFPHWTINKEWQYEQNKSAKRRRIYLKEENVLSLALLRVS